MVPLNYRKTTGCANGFTEADLANGGSDLLHRRQVPVGRRRHYQEKACAPTSRRAPPMSARSRCTPTATSLRARSGCWRRWRTPEQETQRSTMDFGIALPTAADSGRSPRKPRSSGFTHAWFYDTQMLSADCFVAMGAAAVNTRRIRLGTGVLVPSNRIAPVAANALATLNQLAPGRIDFGVGTGFTARRAMGFGAIKVKDMETYIHQVYGLLRRETVEFEMEGQKKKIRFLNPELPLFNTKDPIALHLLGLRAAHPCADGQAQGGLDRLRRQGRERHQGSRGHARAPGPRRAMRSATCRPPPSRWAAC